MPTAHTLRGQPRIPCRRRMSTPGHARPAAAAAVAPADAGDPSWAFSTRLLHPRKVFTDPYSAISPPLYQVRVAKRGWRRD